ncbi:MAG TPA: peptidoglycan-binding protein [Usitatibacter sp.]|nr:peptidoglycan-binding protein [Usitatibacter sp.]
MQVIQRAAVGWARNLGDVPLPRIRPVHDPVDRRHSDLTFSVEAGGRPFRVLIARDPSLFAPQQAGARNASNFYDSQREGLLHDDGPPCFYLVPRSVLHALLPAPRLYYTLIVYADDGGRNAVYAHAPESLPREAPYVTLSSDLNGSLALMFGTPVANLVRLTASAPVRAEAAEEVGEDLEAEAPESIGLADEDGDADQGLSEAAAYDLADEADESVQPVDDAASLESHEGYDDGYGYDESAQADALADDGPSREPVLEESGAAGLEEEEEPAAQSLADDYDDGYGVPPRALPAGLAAPAKPAPAGHYGAEHEAAAKEPDALPDEDAEDVHAAQAGEHDEDQVEIEAAAYAETPAPAPVQARPQPFDIEACKAVLARIMPFESGADGYARVVEDGEFAGRFGTAHPAYRRYHLGLTFGAFPFVQEHGTLGQLLAMMRERDASTFDSIFPQGAQLIAVTTSNEGPRAWESPDGYSARLAPVAGKRLWEEPWLARFRRAGAHPAFQGAQNELAARLYVQPVLPIARQIGLDSDQALTLVVDRAVQMGPQAALAWVLEAATPVETPALRQRALASLGFADLQAFQRAQRLPVNGLWDVATHAALIAALRSHPQSPTPVLGRDEIVAAMLRHAQGTPWAERMKKLREATAADRVFEL